MILISAIAAGWPLRAPPAKAVVQLEGTAWQTVADHHGLDPRLLYAIALVESGRRVRSGMVAPTPFAVRGPNGPYYGADRHDALDWFAALSEQAQRGSDLGLMQINVRWHRHRVRNVAELFDPATSLAIGAAILADAMASAPGDVELGVGHYHSWSASRARAYGRRVLTVYRRLLETPAKTGRTAPPVEALWRRSK